MRRSARASFRAPGRPFRTPTYDMGASSIPVDKALRLAADLEDEVLIRKLAEHK